MWSVRREINSRKKRDLTSITSMADLRKRKLSVIFSFLLLLLAHIHILTKRRGEEGDFIRGGKKGYYYNIVVVVGQVRFDFCFRGVNKVSER